MRSILAAALLAGCLAAGTAQAQSGGLGNLGGLAGGLGGGGLGGMVPGLGSTTAGNAAGLLGYCLKNKLLGGADATGAAGSALGQLTGRKGVADTPAFAAGQRGQVVSGSGRSFSLANVGDQIKGKACDLILQRAQSFVAAR